MLFENPRDFDQLVDSIKANGLLRPAEIDGNGLLIDGRCRLMACAAAGIELGPDDIVVTDADPYAIAGSNNARRHLTKDQKVMETRRLLEVERNRPKPSLRKNIPKGNEKTRPLGIACVEDKLVQRAVVMILERIYEVDFYDFSYGYRRKKSCHEALATLGGIIATQKVNWISDADIKGFFDNLSQARLVELLRKRISDPKLLRLIERFLKAGVMIDGQFQATEDGVPQGASLSPLLANVYLH